jgi:hypothetical protein
VITPQPLVQPINSTSAPAPASAQSAKASASSSAPIQKATRPDIASAPAVTTSIFINPKTLRTVAKLTDAATGEVIGFIPPKLVSASYSATTLISEPGLVTSGLS